MVAVRHSDTQQTGSRAGLLVSTVAARRVRGTINCSSTMCMHEFTQATAQGMRRRCTFAAAFAFAFALTDNTTLALIATAALAAAAIATRAATPTAALAATIATCAVVGAPSATTKQGSAKRVFPINASTLLANEKPYV